MGAFISTENCAAYYGIKPNCSVLLSEDNSTAVRLGEYSYGKFPADADIAGVGVLGAFLCVTATSLLLSIASTFWWSSKNVVDFVRRLDEKEKSLKNWQLSVAGIIEALIVTCSDQQVFTGGAFAITLRYAKACSVSAYHYNIVANILLVTCATHLMAVTIARHYWHHPYVGILRITVTTLVFVITGVLLSNQGSGSLGFPTEVPRLNDQYSLMLLPAACFQSGDFLFDKQVGKALSVGSVEEFFTGQIHGWTNYLIMFLFYMIAVVVSLGRMLRRGMGHNGKRKRFTHWLERTFPFFFRRHVKKLFYGVFGLYLTAGIALSAWTVAVAAIYVFRLRWWVDKSGWIERPGNRNPENDPSTFGQLVPLLLMSLTVFTFLQIVSERIHARRRRDKRHEYTSVRRRSRSRSPSPSGTATTRTRDSTLSVFEVRSDSGPMRELDRVPREGDPQQLYDYPYSDSSKHKPVVGVTIVEEPGDAPEREHDHENGHEQEQRRWSTGGVGRGHPSLTARSTGAPTRRMSLFERMTRAKGESMGVTKRRGQSGGEGEGDLDRAPYMGWRASVVSLPVGVGAGFSATVGDGERRGSRHGSGEWFAQRRQSQNPPVSSLVRTQVQEEHDIGLRVEDRVEHEDSSVPMMYRDQTPGDVDEEHWEREFGVGGVWREGHPRTP